MDVKFLAPYFAAITQYTEIARKFHQILGNFHAISMYFDAIAAQHTYITWKTTVTAHVSA